MVKSFNTMIASTLEMELYGLRARAKTTSHFQGPFIPASGVAKIQNIPDIL